MNIDQFKAMFSSEAACREYLESIIWRNGRRCPHCQDDKSYPIKGARSRSGLYECHGCKKQFTVTTHTPMHSTKLPLWKWLLAIYYIIYSSKGISSIVMSRWIGVSQKTAWKIGHAIREMMKPGQEGDPLLKDIVELDDKYVGGKPRYQENEVNKRGRGTGKQCVLIAAQRQGHVKSALLSGPKIADISPLMKAFINKEAHLMSDNLHAFKHIGKDYAAHDSVCHSSKEYVMGNAHSNTAESFGAIIERARQGVFHYMSKAHLSRYLNEIGFRWNHRIPKEIKKCGKRKIRMVPMPLMDMLSSLLSKAVGTQTRRSSCGGITCIPAS